MSNESRPAPRSTAVPAAPAALRRPRREADRPHRAQAGELAALAFSLPIPAQRRPLPVEYRSAS